VACPVVARQAAQRGGSSCSGFDRAVSDSCDNDATKPQVRKVARASVYPATAAAKVRSNKKLRPLAAAQAQASRKVRFQDRPLVRTFDVDDDAVLRQVVVHRQAGGADADVKRWTRPKDWSMRTTVSEARAVFRARELAIEHRRPQSWRTSDGVVKFMVGILVIWRKEEVLIFKPRSDGKQWIHVLRTRGQLAAINPTYYTRAEAIDFCTPT